MPDRDVAPEVLARAVAARLIHDLIGPAGGLVSAFDLIADPAAANMREEAIELASASARGLRDQLLLARAIHAGGDGQPDPSAMAALARGLFASGRAAMTLEVEPEAAAMRPWQALLGMLQVVAAALAAGGVARAALRVAKDGPVAEVTALGPRARLAPEALAGWRGLTLAEGLSHRWSATYFLQATIRAGGGSVDAEILEEGFVLRARL